MITRNRANWLICVLSVTISLCVLAVFLYVVFTPEMEDRENILIGTGIGLISSICLTIYIWINRHNL